MKSEIVLKRYSEVGEIKDKCEHLNDWVKPVIDSLKDTNVCLEGVEYGHVQNSLFPEKYQCYVLTISRYFRNKSIGCFSVVLLETDKEKQSAGYILAKSFSGVFDINFFILTPETKTKEKPEDKAMDVFPNEDCDTIFLFNSNANSTLKSILETVIEASLQCIANREKSQGVQTVLQSNGTTAKSVPMVNAFNVLSGGNTNVKPETMEDLPVNKVMKLVAQDTEQE